MAACGRGGCLEGGRGRGGGVAAALAGPRAGSVGLLGAPRAHDFMRLRPAGALADRGAACAGASWTPRTGAVRDWPAGAVKVTTCPQASITSGGSSASGGRRES